MEARNRPLHDWFPRIKSGQLRLPRFQREEAWGVRQIEGLIQTVLSELPAGSVLTLEVAGNEPFISRPLAGVDPLPKDRATEHLLDGQQRLTALWKALNDRYEDRMYFISLEADDDAGSEFSAASFPRYMKNGELYPIWMNDPERIWERNLIPVTLLRPDSVAEANSKDWAKKASNGNVETQIKINDYINSLRNRFSNFNIPFLSLPSQTDPSVALDVFLRMNTSSSPLTPFDIVVAQAEARTGESLHERIKHLQIELPEFENYVSPGEAVLSIGALISSKPPVRKSFLAGDFSKSLIDNFSRIQRGIQRTITLFEEERLYSEKFLPTELAFYVLSALWAENDVSLDAEGNLRALSKEYLWSAFLTDRYEKTGSTRALTDFRQLSDHFNGKLSRDGVEIFDRSVYKLPSSEDLIAASWPARKDRLSRAILLLSLRGGAFDFADGSEISAKNYHKREFHHVFPKAYLRELGISESLINKSINCALISGPTNRTIGAKDPISYLTTRTDSASLGPSEIKRRIESHLMPCDEFLGSNYEQFVNQRAQFLSDRINSMFIQHQRM
ncbi:DUF262 domain-containing protein [Microvirga sp. ACRRW]|uniref:DUF262 domain-containing protein n=1 Tax=Microvirga sp. ACRRW TaxID=2918205 RepID=UPI001EF42C4A|nr:DUF262 domain-containing protein [Microvirga sp. ACRRW]MCG7394750.1 DUF262 domain-containing protein [Microvirga sp. ACRRW]